MDEKQFDQEARVALMNEYSSNKQSWAVVALTIVIAGFSLVQTRDIIRTSHLFYIGFGFLSSQAVYSALRYLHYAQASTFVTKSRAVTGEGARRLEDIDYPYVHLLQLGISVDVTKKRFGRVISDIHGLKWWIGISFILTLILTILGPLIWQI